MYLDIIDGLSIKEFKIAALLYNLKEIEKRSSSGDNPNEINTGSMPDSAWLSEIVSGYDKEEISPILVRLEKHDLIKELVGSFIGYGGGTYTITSLFRKLMKFIQTDH